MLKRAIAIFLIALSFGAAIFANTSYACSDSDTRDCSSPPPDPPKPEPK